MATTAEVVDHHTQVKAAEVAVLRIRAMVVEVAVLRLPEKVVEVAKQIKTSFRLTLERTTK
jgi:hypothetical protein